MGHVGEVESQGPAPTGGREGRESSWAPSTCRCHAPLPLPVAGAPVGTGWWSQATGNHPAERYAVWTLLPPSPAPQPLDSTRSFLWHMSPYNHCRALSLAFQETSPTGGPDPCILTPGPSKASSWPSQVRSPPLDNQMWPRVESKRKGRAGLQGVGGAAGAGGAAGVGGAAGAGGAAHGPASGGL